MFKRILSGYALLLPMLLVFSATTQAALNSPSGAYVLENTHGYITFSYSHLGFSNPQVGFRSFTVDVELDAADPARSKVKVGIDPNSIDSRVDEFNARLKGENFFNTVAHPSITFESTSIAMTSDTTADITGNLTIKGITKPVTLAAKLNKADVHPMRKVATLGLDATAQVKRSEFGLGEYVPMVGDDVTISISVELIKKP